MKLTILTPEVTLFEGDATGVQFPGIDGSFEILENHASIISALRDGIIRINSNAGSQKIQVNGGIIECNNNVVTVVVESGKKV